MCVSLPSALTVGQILFMLMPTEYEFFSLSGWALQIGPQNRMAPIILNKFHKFMELITLNKSACILAGMHTDTGSTPESVLYAGLLKMFKHVEISRSEFLTVMVLSHV
jgi:hypothetical protein